MDSIVVSEFVLVNLKHGWNVDEFIRQQHRQTKRKVNSWSEFHRGTITNNFIRLSATADDLSINIDFANCIFYNVNHSISYAAPTCEHIHQLFNSMQKCFVLFFDIWWLYTSARLHECIDYPPESLTSIAKVICEKGQFHFHFFFLLFFQLLIDEFSERQKG